MSIIQPPARRDKPRVSDQSCARSEPILLAGLGVIAPGASDWKEFLSHMKDAKCHLSASTGLAPSFLVGKPAFDFSLSKDWITSRHNPSKYQQLVEKGGENVQLAVASTIQALESNPGLEQLIRNNHKRVLILSGNAFGDLPSVFEGRDDFYRATRDWNHFWADPRRNEAVAKYLDANNGQNAKNEKLKEDRVFIENVPPNPWKQQEESPKSIFENYEACLKWDAYWAPRSAALKAFFDELEAIQSMGVGPNVANDKLNLIRSKAKAKKALFEKYGCPRPPWESVNPKLLWNLPNASASQLSMLLGTHGPSYGMYGACATFGLLLFQAKNAILAGQADLAIVSTSDNTPPDELVSAFYGARVLAGGFRVSEPLTDMRGTHVSGGACTWILASEGFLKRNHCGHFGIEVAGVGLSSDAEHIITPSVEGPKLSIEESLRDASSRGISANDLALWDLHATGTPGDLNELEMLAAYVPQSALISARKGLFGHGMGSCGGWELTALSFSVEGHPAAYTVWPSGIDPAKVHPAIAKLERQLVLDQPTNLPPEVNDSTVSCGKLSMGIGGISSCVIISIDVEKRTAFAGLKD